MPGRRERRDDSRRPIALIVTPRYLPLLGGMERECALLADAFARQDWQPLILTEELGTGLPLSETLAGVPVRRVRSSPQRSALVQLRVAAAMAAFMLRNRRRVAFAVVRTFTLPALVVGLLKALRLVRFPTLVTAETGGGEDDVVALARRPLFPVSRALASRHDLLNGICRANVEHLHEHGFPPERISSIPNGIDTGAWATARPPQRVRRLLFLGRLDPAKGVFELVEAFARVRADHPDVSLTFAGDGEARAGLEHRCDELGLGDAVVFLGLVEHERIGELFAEHDCMVLPSYSEGMPLSVLEAAVHRRVLVLSDVGDVAELFDGEVHLCTPRDVGALAAAIADAVADDSPAADYADVVARVSIDAVAAEMSTRLTGAAGPRA